MKENPIFLHRFAPYKIAAKAQILNLHATDFAIQSSGGVLTLIELERPGCKLLKKDGHRTADLNHAFSQVEDWLEELKREWSATIRCLGFDSRQITKVQGVVIAGRDLSCAPEALLRLKGASNNSIEFMTFDDLLADVVNLSRTLR